MGTYFPERKGQCLRQLTAEQQQDTAVRPRSLSLLYDAVAMCAGRHGSDMVIGDRPSQLTGPEYSVGLPTEYPFHRVLFDSEAWT